MTEPMTAPKVSATPQRPRSLFRNRDYMLLWGGQTVSTIGTEVSMVAFPFLVLALTGSPAQAGLMGGLRALPYLLFSLPAGALVDRWNRKTVMILSDSGRALALGSIPLALLLGHLTLAQLYAVSAVEGTLFVFFNLAEVASLPRVVPKEQLPAANAQYSATDGTSALVGPALGGALFGVAQALPFVADAVSYAASVLSLTAIRARFQGERRAERQRLWREVGEGLSWLWHQPLIRFIALLTGMSNLTSAGFVLIIIVLAQRVQATPFATGLIFTIGGIGGILGSLIASPLQRRLSFGTVIISTSFAWAFLWVAYIFAPNIWVMGAITAASFVLNPIYNVTQLSYRLALIPDALQGRVNSVFRLLAFGGQPLGYALTGAALERFGPISTVAAIGAVQLVMATITALNAHVRHARPIEQLQPA
jgi:predicted MFS family arabinose efflux permease